MITFYKLLDVLNRRHITIKELQLAIGASPNTMAKIRKNESISLSTVGKICDYLDCQPGDIMENEKNYRKL